jgi:hypothetical protein
LRRLARPTTDTERAEGSRYGRWVLVERASGMKVRARCDCGNEKVVYFFNLRSGMSRSCGCLAREVCSANARTHGGTGTAIYRIWAGMKARCHGSPRLKQFKDYGGRGIAVCPEWLGDGGFERFVADMGPRPSPKHSLDRYPDNNGNYEPGNCRWATDKEQARNTRRNVWLEHGGRRMLATDWATELGISRQAIEQRIRWGWSEEKICTTRGPKLADVLRGRVPGTRKLVCNGVRDTVAGWERRTGVNHRTILTRLKAGRSVEEALTVGRLPVRRRPREAVPRVRYDHPRPPRKRTQCSRCAGFGHNKATCENQIKAA